MTMAAGAAPWQYYNNSPKYPHMPPPTAQSPFGAAGGDVQDMHLKMSKKIAQLTKVIYSLNTKNDEHEAAMIALKEAHEEENQQLLTETAAKIEHYRQKIGNELDLRRRIQNLEEYINTAEKEKRQAMIEFESFKRQVEEREMRQESDHTLKVMSLTKDLVDSKNEFESRLREFENMKSIMRNEGGVELEKLNNEHLKALDRLHAMAEEKEIKFKIEKKAMVDAHERQIKELEQEISNLKQEFKKTEDDFENKMNKAKLFYEKELAVARSQASSTDAEATKRWQEREAEIIREAARVEATLKKKLAQAEDEIRIQTDEASDLTKKLEDATSQMSATLSHNEELQADLSKTKKECSNALDQVRFLQEELSVTRARLESQENDLLKKSSLIGTLEALKLTQEATMQDLEKEILCLKSRITQLELERSSLQSDSSEQVQQLSEQLQVLGKRLETVVDEKLTLQDNFNKSFEQLKQSHVDEMKQLTEQYESERKTMERNHQSLIDSMKMEAQNAMDGMLQEMQERLRKEATELIEEKREAVAHAEAEKRELHEKLNSAQNEVTRLEEAVRRHEDGLGDASSHIKGLNSRIAELQKELEMADGRLRTSETSNGSLRRELESLKSAHELEMNSEERRHRNEIEKLTSNLNSKWQDQIRCELDELQGRLNAQHMQDRRVAIEQLQTQKDRELEAARSGWKEQINQLTTMISELKKAMEQQQKDYDRTLAEERTNAAQNERSMQQSASQAASEYASKIASLENAHRMEMAAAEQKKDQELRALEGKLMSQHREELQTQMQAHRFSAESLKEKLNKDHEEEMMRKEQEHLQDMDEMRSELSHQHASAIDEITRQNENKMMVARSELERALDATRRQEADFSRKVTGLEEDLSQKNSLVNGLQEKISLQNDAIVSLNKEVDRKGHEILKIRSEANTELRRREDEITRKYQREQDRTEAENLRQKQALVSEFNRATEALKDKISSLNIALREAEDRFERRESRSEDLHTIRELKQLVSSREAEIQKLIDDKKYYQLELVNRETNFNKVFSASPNVGVLNPLNTQKKKGDKTSNGRYANQFVSVPNLSSLESALSHPNRLGPIKTGSPSPSSTSSSSFTKNHQPTPPTLPKKFLRLNGDELPERYQTTKPSLNCSRPDSPLVIEEDFFLPSSILSKYQIDDFEGSIKEFDAECENIRSSTNDLNRSCASLNQLEMTDNKKGKIIKSPKQVLARSATLPLNYQAPDKYRLPRPVSQADVSDDSDDDMYADIDVFINDTWAKRDEKLNRFSSNFSASVPNRYLDPNPRKTLSRLKSQMTRIANG